MPENRGFHFLAGLASLWLLWRLYAAGIIFQAIAYTTGVDVCCVYGEPIATSGPGAIIVSFFIEAIITIGWVVTLLASGLWDAALVVGRLIGDAFGAGHSYLKAAQSTPVADSKPASVATPSPTPDRVLTPEQQAIEMLSLQLVEISKRLPPVPVSVAEVAK